MQIFSIGLVRIHCPVGATRKLDRPLVHVDHAACPYVTSPTIAKGNVCKDDNVTIVLDLGSLALAFDLCEPLIPKPEFQIYHEISSER